MRSVAHTSILDFRHLWTGWNVGQGKRVPALVKSDHHPRGKPRRAPHPRPGTRCCVETGC
jgi:hypothetical protein